MISYGEWEFTEDDARATLRHGIDLVDLAVDGLDPAALAPVADRIERGRAEARAAVDDVAAPLGERLARVIRGRATVAGAVRDSGALGPMARGTVAHLARGPGGVPKASCAEVEVGWSGVVGDAQADRANHGRPWQAVCLWSTEVIDAFAAAGHPLAPGRAGENITISGIAWDRVRPGSIIEIGEHGAEVAIELWAYATPCRTNARWFTGARFDLMHHRHGAVSRVYGWVLQPGTVRLGDPVKIHRHSGPTATVEGLDHLDPATAVAVRGMVDRAFDRFTEEDWSNALGGHHAVARLPDDTVVAHAAIVPRPITIGDRAVRAGYVEAVATDPLYRGRSHAGEVMEVVGRIVHAHHELGVLSTAAHPVFEPRGWERWQGPSFVRSADGTVRRTPDEDAGIMVLRTDATADIDLTASITCDERPGDDW